MYDLEKTRVHDVIIINEKIIIEDLRTFLDSEDSLLVLQYGRAILDKNIIETLNDYYFLNLNIDIFDDFIKLGITNDWH